MEPVGGEHGDLYKNSGLKTTLFSLLGRPGFALAAGNVPEISVRRKVVNPDDDVEVTIDFPTATVTATGALCLRRATDSSGTPDPAALWTEISVISYSGPRIDHLMVIINVPSFSGIYELGYFPAGGQESPAKTEIFIQEP